MNLYFVFICYIIIHNLNIYLISMVIDYYNSYIYFVFLPIYKNNLIDVRIINHVVD